MKDHVQAIPDPVEPEAKVKKPRKPRTAAANNRKRAKEAEEDEEEDEQEDDAAMKPVELATAPSAQPAAAIPDEEDYDAE